MVLRLTWPGGQLRSAFGIIPSTQKLACSVFEAPRLIMVVHQYLHLFARPVTLNLTVTVPDLHTALLVRMTAECGIIAV